MRVILMLLAVTAAADLRANDKVIQPVVEAEENVFNFEPANNGAGPMWCSGSTCLVIWAMDTEVDTRGSSGRR